MSKFDEKVEKYTEHMKEKLGMTPDADLFAKVTKGCGPSIYNRDAETVAATDASEVETVKQNFVIKKLGVTDEAAADAGVSKVLDMYSKKSRTKYRAVVYYLLTKEFGKESVYA
ncbi:MAG: DUF2853 family protein [Pseudomonadota bacterium]